MDLVKIGFQINANGLKDANVEVDKLLTKVTRVSSKSINLKVKLDNSIQTVKKTLSDVEKIKNNLSALNIKVSMVGYSQVKANLEKLEALKKSVKDIQVRFTTIGNVNKIRDDFLKLKNKIITVKVVTSTAQLDNLKKKLDSIKNKTVKLNINLPKSSEVEKLGKALDKLTNKKVKIEVILTPDLTTVKEYANALDRIRSSRTTTTTNLGGGTGGSGGRSPAGAFDQVIGIAKYALLSTAIYGVMTATTNLAVATVKMADEYTAIQNRMKLYVTDAQELTKVNAQLAQFSIANNVGLRETATLFSRLQPAMQKIGANTAAVTSVVDAFGKSLRIGGATAQEAASATIQFSQAMASGKLAGDEFRSISEASPRFLQAIAEGSGIAADQLKKMSAAGMLTTEVISKALLKEYPKLIEENKKLGITLEQGANALKTGFLVAFGEFNEGAGITKALGESMANLAQSMLTAAQGARQFGVEAKASFEKYLPVIQAVGNVLKFVAIVAITKFAASMIVAGAISLKTAYSMNIAALGATALQRAFGVAAIASLRLGSALASLATPANLFTLGLTVAGVATAYSLMKDSAAEANQKLAEQSIYLNKTTEDFKALNAEQLKNAQFKVKVDMEEANKNIEEAKAKYLDYITTVGGFNEKSGLSGYVPDKEGKAAFEALKAAANDGTKSLDSVTTAMLEQGLISKEYAKEIYAITGNYDKAVTSGINMSETAKALGINTEVSGNKMQNAAIKAQLLGDGFSDIAEKAKIATNEVGKLVKELNTKLSEAKLSYSIEDSTGLGRTYSTDIAADAVAKAAAKEAELNKKNIDALAKLNELRQQGANLSHLVTTSDGKVQTDATSQLEKNTEELMKQTALYNKLKTQSPLVKVDPLTQVDPKAVAVAKELEALDKKRAERDAARNKTDKDGDKDLKRLESIREGYEDQVGYVGRLQNLLQNGVDINVARIAAEKGYARYIVGTGLAMEVVQAQQKQSRIDFLATLATEEEQQERINNLLKIGLTYEQAKTLAENKFTDDLQGRAAAEQLITNQLFNQNQQLDDMISQQDSINNYLAGGMSLEQATMEVTKARLQMIRGGNLSDEQKALAKEVLKQQERLKLLEVERGALSSIGELDKQRVAYVNAQAGGYANLIKNMAIANKIASDPTLSPDQAKKLVEAEELTNYEKEIANLKAKTYIATLKESDAVKDIISNYATWDSVQVGAYDRQQKLLGIAKELSDEAERQRNNPIGDFSSVDFNVFGDFGNPFESALAGLNEFVAKSTESRNILASIEKDIVAAKEQGLSVNDLELDRNRVLANQEKDRKKSIDKAITSGLSLTKSLFKEESKGYKVVSGLEKAYQASKIAFALWEKKDTITSLALSLKAHISDMLGFTTAATTKVAAQGAVNVAKGTEAVLNQGTGDPYTAFARMAAMVAAVAALGVAIGSFSGSGGEYVDTSNQGTGTVFGDSEAKSSGIANSIDLLSENSDLMLPLTSAMLRSLRNIESNIGGLTNLIIRTGVGKDSNIAEGFQQNSTGKYLGMAGQLAGGVGGAIGGGIAGAFGAGLLGAGMGSALGIGLGLATGGIGLLLGASLGKLLGGLFGTKTTIKASGLYGGNQKLGDILSEGFNLQEYVDIQTKKKTLGITTSNKSSTKYSKADAELSNQFTLIFKGFYDTILSATDILGADLSVVQTNLENAVVSIGKINLKGLSGEEIQEKLEAVFGAAADSLAKQAFGGLEDFQSVGEGYYETLIKVATGVEQAKYFTDRLNVTAIKYTDILNKQGDVAAEIVRQSVLLNNSTKDIKGGFYDLVNSFDGSAEEITDFVLTLRDLQDQLFMTGKNADYLTSSMILGAGGLDSLASGLDAYFEMLSPAEQAAELTRRLTNEFAILGKELPSDVKAFRNLVSSIDISSEAGQKLYGQILALAPEFNDLQDSIKSANSEVNALVQSLRDLAEQARAARGETEQPRNLAYTRSQFEQASVLAMQGDIASAEKLLTLGKDLMSLSKTYSVTGSEYARDLALIQRAATVSADIQEQGLGTSISTTLTPSTGTGTTTPTIATTNSTMTTELQGMREELNAGLFAIAKFVQNVDSRTERWDDGNRVMVGIQPENGDTPVPVVVTP